MIRVTDLSPDMRMMTRGLQSFLTTHPFISNKIIKHPDVSAYIYL
jgi:exopolysaccharide biosynthesis predicted pyruvyltransferase EpsI